MHVLSQRQHVLANCSAAKRRRVNKVRPLLVARWPRGMPILDDAAWFIGRTRPVAAMSGIMAYLLEPVSVWAQVLGRSALLSDLDLDIDDIDPGKEASPVHRA